MNFIPLIEQKLTELRKESPELTFGALLYSVLRKQKPEHISLGWLLDIEDKDFYTFIEKELEFQIQDKG
ncbi:MAG: hypothetical protein PQJ49_08095 [Sphaerochaetaceae bacterium]|nr:hypothetical protein [Sphaerochaetaceae bacterium]